MTKKDKLKIDLARNIVVFDSYKDFEMKSVCVITIGGKIAVKPHSLDGEEKEVLEEMSYVFWSVRESVVFN